MSWLSVLFETYNYLDAQSQKEKGSVIGLEFPAVISQNAHITVVLNTRSEFMRAEEINKEDSKTMIPATKDSSGARTRGSAPHMIFDNLKYVCGDLRNYLPQEQADETYEKYYKAYLLNLEKWLNVDPSNKYVKIVYEYIKKECMLGDLIDADIVNLDENGFLAKKSKRIKSVEQEKIFVRFAIEENGSRIELWTDEDFLRNYSRTYLEMLKKEGNITGFCYGTGHFGEIANKHGKYIRFPGDDAKLISSNDSKNFTYRGRFEESEQAYQVSYEVSEKAHSALRYLIQKRASTFKRNGMTVVAWSDGSEIPMSGEDTNDIMSALLGEDQNVATEVDTDQDFAYELKKALNSFKNELKVKTVNIMMLDAATPGRMAVQYFKQFDIEDYLENLFKWHRDLCWIQHYKKEGDEKIREYRCAPSVYDICLYSFGVEREGKMVLNEKDKFVNQKIRRIFPCILEGQRLPIDYMRGAYHNAVNPVSKEEYNWIKCLGVACSLIHKYYIDRGRSDFSMALNERIKDRSYLFGRLLAIADKVESIALSMKNEKRPTSARRLMNAFSKKPYSTWGILELKLNPYFERINPKSRAYYRKELNVVMDVMEMESYQSNKPLEPSFLLGYHNQLQKFSRDSRAAKEEGKEKENKEESTNDN